MTEATVTTHDNADLLAQLDKEPERGNEWKPEEEGDTILGTLETVEHPRTKDGRYLPVLILETDDGPTRVAVLHSVLKNELLDRKVQTGDRIAIRYVGKKTASRRSEDIY